MAEEYPEGRPEARCGGFRAEGPGSDGFSGEPPEEDEEATLRRLRPFGGTGCGEQDSSEMLRVCDGVRREPEGTGGGSEVTAPEATSLPFLWVRFEGPASSFCLACRKARDRTDSGTSGESGRTGVLPRWDPVRGTMMTTSGFMLARDTFVDIFRADEATFGTGELSGELSCSLVFSESPALRGVGT